MRCGRAHTQHKVLGALRHAPIPVLSRHRLILLLLSCPRLPALGLCTLFSPDRSALGKGWMEAGIMSSSSTLLQSVPGVWDLTKPTKTQGTLRNESNAKKYVERETKKMKFTDMSSRRSRARLSAPRALPPQQDATAPRCTGAISACHFPKFMHVVFLEGPRDVTECQPSPYNRQDTHIREHTAAPRLAGASPPNTFSRVRTALLKPVPPLTTGTPGLGVQLRKAPPGPGPTHRGAAAPTAPAAAPAAAAARPWLR